MTHRITLSAGAVTLIALVGLTAATQARVDAGWILLVCVFVAIGAALQSAAWEPSDFTPAMLFSLPPVIALTAEGSPVWLLPLLGSLLLVAGELNALGWECDGRGPTGDALRRRLRDIGRLGLLGLAAALLVFAAGAATLLTGIAALTVGAAGIALIGIRFRRP